MSETTELALSERSPTDVVAMTRRIQEIMQAVMQDGQHYGMIPGCGDKPVLLKPGAEKLCVLFRLACIPTVETIDLGGGHREYRVRTEVRHITSGDLWGVGVGSCSSMESKYRWRTSDRVCPRCSKPTIIKGKAEYGGGWICFSKKGGCGAKFSSGDRSIEGQDVGRCENPDIADQWNTILKMAKKRSLVDAAITATAASDLFTQDLDDLAATEDRMARHEPVDVEIVEPAKAQPRQASHRTEEESPPRPTDDDRLNPDHLDELAALFTELASVNGRPKTWTVAQVLGALRVKRVAWACRTMTETMNRAFIEAQSALDTARKAKQPKAPEVAEKDIPF